MNDTLRQWLLHTGFYVFGILTGATIMIYIYEQPKLTKPVVTVEQDGARTLLDSGSPSRGYDHQQARDAAPLLAQVEAEKERHLQRVKELRFSLAKEERLQKERFAEAVANRDSIREMVAKLKNPSKERK